MALIRTRTEAIDQTRYYAKPIAALFSAEHSVDVDLPVKGRAHFMEGLEGKGETKPYGLRGGAMQGAPSLRGNSYWVYRPFLTRNATRLNSLTTGYADKLYLGGTLAPRNTGHALTETPRTQQLKRYNVTNAVYNLT
jgi:hypothetical protein